MPYMYSFCFVLSLRLGTITVGIVSFLQGIISIIITSLALESSDEISKKIQASRKEIDFIFIEPILETVQQDVYKYMSVLLIFFVFYTLFCLILIYGAYTMNTNLMYPYVAIELKRLLIMFGIHVSGMMLIKQNSINLGLLIGLSVFGGFVLLCLFYMWFCALSLVQVLKELRKEIKITDITNFPQKPVTISDVYTIRNRYYNY